MATISCTILVAIVMICAIYKVTWSVAVKMSWTNLTYEIFDPNFAQILYCRLKPFKKDMNIISLRVRLMGAPLKNVTMAVRAYRKYGNTDEPSVIDVEFDACKFLRSPKSIPIAYFFYDFFLKYSNLNHSCPYSGDVIIQNMPLDMRKLRNFPIPFVIGDYALHFIWKTFAVARGAIHLYARVEQAR